MSRRATWVLEFNLAGASSTQKCLSLTSFYEIRWLKWSPWWKCKDLYCYLNCAATWSKSKFDRIFVTFFYFINYFSFSSKWALLDALRAYVLAAVACKRRGEEKKYSDTLVLKMHVYYGPSLPGSIHIFVDEWRKMWCRNKAAFFAFSYNARFCAIGHNRGKSFCSW